MFRKSAAFAVALAAVVAACSSQNNGSTGNSTSALPGLPDMKMTVTLPNGKQYVVPAAKSGTISEELPGEGLGTVDDTYWSATLGGFTQQQYSQALGFPPGTKITMMNISKAITHTLNFVKKIKGPPANFPSSPKLSLTAHGTIMEKGYASGPISPGKSVTLTLSKAGIYLIGCAYHYGEGMHTVLVVKKGATPGPQATP